MTGGAQGQAPEWFTVAQAAKYWGVAPWEMAAQSVYWIHVAADLAAAEKHKADIEQQKRDKAHQRK